LSLNLFVQIGERKLIKCEGDYLQVMLDVFQGDTYHTLPRMVVVAGSSDTTRLRHVCCFII